MEFSYVARPDTVGPENAVGKTWCIRLGCPCQPYLGNSTFPSEATIGWPLALRCVSAQRISIPWKHQRTLWHRGYRVIRYRAIFAEVSWSERAGAGVADGDRAKPKRSRVGWYQQEADRPGYLPRRQAVGATEWADRTGIGSGRQTQTVETLK